MRRASLSTVDAKGLRALVRADLNVPLDIDRRVTDTLRIEACLPTVRAVLDQGGSVVLMSHLGRPKGKAVEALRMAPVARALQELLGRPVLQLTGCAEAEVAARTAALEPGRVALLENLRFYPGEKAGDEAFARGLAAHGDFFVGDAFGTAHRAHASVAVAPRFCKPAVAGLLLQKEIDAFARILEAPSSPFVLVLGGAKVSDKIPVLENLIDRVDEVVIGGGMAYTFLEARGVAVGNSLLEAERLETAGRILAQAEERGVTVHLPTDHVVAASPDSDTTTVVSGAIHEGMGLDVGPATAEAFRARVLAARTVVWNGPMGVFEREPFSAGTRVVAEALAETQGFTVVGGGDTAAAAGLFGVDGKMDHVSTGGGASLALLSGEPLPGVEALDPA